MPHISLRIVNEKQQLMKPSSFGVVPSCNRLPGVLVPEFELIMGLNRSTHDVSTAFCVESNATLPYFWRRKMMKGVSQNIRLVEKT